MAKKGVVQSIEEADSSGSWKSKRSKELKDDVVEDSNFVADTSPKDCGSKKSKNQPKEEESRFIGASVPPTEAKTKWPHRYKKQTDPTIAKDGKKSSETSPEMIRALRHYTMAEVDDHVYNLYDDAHAQPGEGEEDPYICKIVELFEGVDKAFYVTCQWYYKAKDTPIKENSKLIDDQRVFISEIKDDNPLDCLLEKIIIAKGELGTERPSGPFTYFCDMKYLVPYSTFTKLPLEELPNSQSETPSTVSCELSTRTESEEVPRRRNSQMFLLDMYAGCGAAMSLCLCLGSKLAGFDLIKLQRCAVDMNEYACETLRNNHPETVVRNKMAGNFLSLLTEWRKLCATFSLITSSEADQLYDIPIEEEDETGDDEDNPDNGEDSEIFEVDKVLDICYGDPNKVKKEGLYLKVRWKGYGSDEDTWEPIEGPSNCGKAIKEFVEEGYKTKFLPLPLRMLQAASDQLPHDIIFCILMYLPVKSLLRFKTVSKSWNALITNPCFVREHHSRQPLSRLLPVERQEKDGTLIFPMPLSFDTTTKTLCAHPNVYQPVNPYLADRDSAISIGTCFGVFCFGAWNNRSRIFKIKLCNIATGEIKVCPLLNSGKDTLVKYAFGFGCIPNDITSVPEFKVVALIYYARGGRLNCCTHVYSSATNSWKSTESCQSSAYEKGIEVNGVIHWQANSFNTKSIDNKFLLTFDLQKEVFGRIELPQGTFDGLLTKQDDQSLSLIVWTSLTSDYIVSIWVMHVPGSWVRQVTVAPTSVFEWNILGVLAQCRRIALEN